MGVSENTGYLFWGNYYIRVCYFRKPPYKLIKPDDNRLQGRLHPPSRQGSTPSSGRACRVLDSLKGSLHCVLASLTCP